jgi:hypothetical protein
MKIVKVQLHDLCPTWPKSVKNFGNYRYKFITSRKVLLPLHLFVWHSYWVSNSLFKKKNPTKFHEHETNDLVIDPRSQMAKLKWFPHKEFFVHFVSVQ